MEIVNKKIIETSGSELMPASTLSKWNVTFSLLKNLPLSDEPKNIGIFIRGKYPTEGLLCTKWSVKNVKYTMNGSPSDVSFISSLLNSDVGEFIINSRVNSSLTLKVLRNFPTPSITSLQFYYGGILENYIMMIRFFAEKYKDQKGIENVQAVYAFLNLLRNYYVEELYIPGIYKSLNVSIVKPLMDVFSKLVLKEGRLTSIQLIQNLFDSIISEGEELLQAFNKMKILKRITTEAFRTQYASQS